MKIRFDIQKHYEETEIHICCSDRTQEVQKLYQNLEGILNDTVTCYQNQEIRYLAIYEIVRIFSENKKVYLRTGDETYEVRERLYTLEEHLGSRGLVRISNTEIVNISQIMKMDMSYIGTIKMYLKNGDETFVSRRYVSKVKEVLARGEYR